MKSPADKPANRPALSWFLDFLKRKKRNEYVNTGASANEVHSVEFRGPRPERTEIDEEVFNMKFIKESGNESEGLEAGHKDGCLIITGHYDGGMGIGDLRFTVKELEKIIREIKEAVP